MTRREFAATPLAAALDAAPGARWLWQDRVARFEYRQGWLQALTPPIALYDVLAVDL